MPNLREYMEEENKKNMSDIENLPDGVYEATEDKPQAPLQEEATEEATEEASFDAEAFTDDDLGVDIPDIPLPSEAPPEAKVEDKFDSAYKLAINSVAWKESERIEKALNYYNSLLFVFPKSKYSDQLTEMHQELQLIKNKTSTTKS